MQCILIKTIKVNNLSFFTIFNVNDINFHIKTFKSCPCLVLLKTVERILLAENQIEGKNKTFICNH